MLKEKNPLLKIKLHKTTSYILKFYNDNSEVLFTLYDLILENPVEIFWFEFINIFVGYCQLVSYLFDAIVSNQFIIKIIKYIVCSNLESSFNNIRIISNHKTNSFNSSSKRAYFDILSIYMHSLLYKSFNSNINYNYMS